MKLLRKISTLFRSEKLDAEMSDEMRVHLELQAAENEKRGLSADEARYAALRSFGGVEQIKERARDERRRGFVWLEQMAQDVRFALRTLAKHRGFTCAAVVTLGLGIGANTAMFSVVNAVLLRPLPYREPGQLMMLEAKWLPRFPRFPSRARDLEAWREQTTAFQAIAAFSPMAFNFTGGDQPERLTGARVNAHLTTVLGVEPVLGRAFTAEEDVAGNDRVVLLSHGLWRRRFNGDPRVIGSTIRLNEESFTVVGVMPAAFDFPLGTELWKPLGLTDRDYTNGHILWGLGRLRSDATPEQAQAELDAILKRVAPGRPWSAGVVPLLDRYVGEVRPALTLLLGAAGLVLLIACANVMNLLLLRGAARRHEIFLRASLGASRGRVARQLLTEALVLALGGAAAGLLLAGGALRGLAVLAPAGIPRLEQATTLDYRVLGFALLVSTLTGVLFGLAPAFRLSHANLAGALGSRGGSGAGAGSWLRRALVVAEVALALVLLSGAGLLLKSFARLSAVPRGFDATQVLTAKVTLPAASYTEPLRQTQFADRLVAALQGSPGVHEAAVTAGLPFSNVDDVGLVFAGRPPGPFAGGTANSYRVSPRYLAAMQVPLRRGRLFTEADAAGRPPVVLINETLARRFFPDVDPIGQRVDIGGPTYLREIVGVVGDVRQDGLKTPPAPQIYEPFAQKPARSFAIVVRGTADPAGGAETLRRAVMAIDPNLPVSDVRLMQERVDAALTNDRFSTLLLGLFAALALVLALVGVYGVVAFSVTQRTREFGVRLALGASPGGILRFILGQSLRLVLLGLGFGLAAALALSRVFGRLLYDTGPRDPVTLGGVSLLLFAVAALAALVPARRAAKIDPMVALRAE